MFPLNIRKKLKRLPTWTIHVSILTYTHIHTYANTQDRTPHESMPMAHGTRRQYFRLVAGPVSVWYSEHSTPNPNTERYQPEATVIHSNKFTYVIPPSAAKLAALTKKAKDAADDEKFANFSAKGMSCDDIIDEMVCMCFCVCVCIYGGRTCNWMCQWWWW